MSNPRDVLAVLAAFGVLATLRPAYAAETPPPEVARMREHYRASQAPE